jgi:hypothetical protein
MGPAGNARLGPGAHPRGGQPAARDGAAGLAPGEWRAYKVAWLGACVLYDRSKLVAAGGFDFWRHVPANHSGEDVAAQLRVLERDGAAGIVPSGAYHLESPTTVPDREVECHELICQD